MPRSELIPDQFHSKQKSYGFTKKLNFFINLFSLTVGSVAFLYRHLGLDNVFLEKVDSNHITPT